MGTPMNQLPKAVQDQVRAKLGASTNVAPVPTGHLAPALQAEKDPYDSKLERKFAAFLPWLQSKGDFHRWAHEPMKLKLAPNTFYTPDFASFTHIQGMAMVTLYEVKGYWRDDARVKFKIAANMYPEFLFVAVTWDSHAKCWSFTDTKGTKWKERHDEA